LLLGLANAAGVKPEKRGQFFIILDKMDKIGIDGVIEECHSKGFKPEQVSTFFETIDQIRMSNDLSAQIEMLPGSISPEVIESFQDIFRTVKSQLKEGARIIFDPTLVRGMGYYTGPIYEIDSDEFSGAIAGGGRYDEMSAKYLPNPEPAVGISIGFERIISILQEQKFDIPQKKEKLAIIYPKNLSSSEYSLLIQKLHKWTEEGYEVTMMEQKKNMNRQLNQLHDRGFRYFVKYDEGEKRTIQ
jgi:histidyl-tRNA synthetase